MNYSEENFPKKLQKVLIKVECRGFMVIIASLREKCPNTEFFLVRVLPHSVRIRDDTGQKKLRIWTIFTQCIKICSSSKTVSKLLTFPWKIYRNFQNIIFGKIYLDGWLFMVFMYLLWRTVVLSNSLRKISKNMSFLWPVFSGVGTE